MKQPILLKTVLDICFFLLLLTFISAVVILVIALVTGEEIILFEVNEETVSDLSLEAFILTVAELFKAALFVYTVYILRKLVRNFFRRKLFTQYQIASLRLIGQLLIVITILEGLIGFAGNLLLAGRITLRISAELSFGSIWFLLAIGLFFIYLSKIFNNARIMKEENELTV